MLQHDVRESGSTLCNIFIKKGQRQHLLTSLCNFFGELERLGNSL